MIIALAVSLLIPVVIGYFLVCLFWPAPPMSERLMKCCLGVGVGYGVISCLYLVMILAGLPSDVSFAVELIVAAALLAGVKLSARRRTVLAPSDVAIRRPPASRAEQALRVAFLCALALALAAFVVLSLREPHGGDADNWDSWAQWNLRARLIHRLGAQWTAAFSYRQALLYTRVPDYPLLLPLNVARCWNYIGNESTIAPAALALLFTFATAGLVFSTLRLLRGHAQAYAGALVLLGFPAFIRVGAWQYADVPLALFILTTLALFCCCDRAPEGQRGLLVLAGISTGLAAWTKNEGWLFLVAVVVARWIAAGAGGRRRLYLWQMLWYSVGVLPVLGVVVFYKLHFAAANDIVAGLGIRSTFSRLLDPARYFLIIRATVETAFRSAGWVTSLWALVPYAVLMGVSVEKKETPSIITLTVSLSVLLVCYFFIYVVTPFDLDWHLRTSVLRLLLHLWPGFVLTYFLVANKPALVAGSEI